MSEFGWVLNVVGGVLVLVALLRLIPVLHDRRVGVEPTCRGCGYLLIGLPDTTHRCPECGADLTQRDAIRRGTKRPLKRPLGMLGAAALIAVGLFVAGERIDARIKAYNERPLLLFQAVNFGDAKEVARLIQIDPTVVRRSTSSPSLIEIAVRGNSVEIVDLLAKHQPVTIASNQLGSGFGYSFARAPTSASMLHVAASCGSTQVMKYLIEQHRFDVNVRDSLGRTPLHYGAGGWNNPAAGTALLLACPGIDIEAKDRDGVTPFGAAVTRNDVTSAKLLMQAGCTQDGPADDKGRTALHYAVLRGDVDLARQLLARGADLTTPDKDGKAPFQLPRDSNADVASLAVKLIQDAGARGGRQSIAELIKREPRIAFFGKNVLIDTRDRDRVADLLAAGFDPNTADPSGNTRLHLAARDGRIEEMQQMLDAGADINAINRDKQTPFMLACRVPIEEPKHLLLIRGADIERKDGFGCTAMYYAAFTDEKRVRMLVEKGLPLDVAGAIRLNDLASLGRLLDANPWLLDGKHNAEGYTPLALAAVYRNLDAMRLIIERRADINLACTHLALRPIDLAIGTGARDAARLLIERGANVSGELSQPETHHPLHSVVRRGWHEVASAIVDAGADPNWPDKAGLHPLSIAVALRDMEMVRLLLSRGADPKLLPPNTVSSLSSATNDDQARAILSLLNP